MIRLCAGMATRDTDKITHPEENKSAWCQASKIKFISYLVSKCMRESDYQMQSKNYYSKKM